MKSSENQLKQQILKAARASSIPEAVSGLWYVHKVYFEGRAWGYRHDKLESVPAGTYTYLYYIDEPDKPVTTFPVGQIIMEDTPQELLSHLNFMLRAKGNVLVTGLGLGCVIRGLLANPNVRRVTCIEKSQDVINLIGPYIVGGRLSIVKADALKWTRENQHHFDCAYHDLWTNRKNGEPHLQRWHAQLLLNCKDNVEFQCAWDLPRWFKRRTGIK